MTFITYPTHPPVAPSISWTYKQTPYNPFDAGVGYPCCIVATPSPCTCPSAHNIAQPTTFHADYVPSTNAMTLVKRYTECILESYRFQVNFPVFTTREYSFRIGYRRMTIPFWDPLTTVAPFLPSLPGDPPPDSGDTPQGLIITQEIADRWLWNDLVQIAKNFNSTFLYPLHQNQVDALCSFLYSGGALNSVLLTAINNVQQFQGTCSFTNPSPPHNLITDTFTMSQWDPIFDVAGAEMLKYVYYRGNKIQSFVDRRYEEYNMFTGLSIPYTIPGYAAITPFLATPPFWGPCAVHQASFANVFGESSTGLPYWKGSLFP